MLANSQRFIQQKKSLHTFVRIVRFSWLSFSLLNEQQQQQQWQVEWWTPKKEKNLLLAPQNVQFSWADYYSNSMPLLSAFCDCHRVACKLFIVVLAASTSWFFILVMCLKSERSLLVNEWCIKRTWKIKWKNEKKF